VFRNRLFHSLQRRHERKIQHPPFGGDKKLGLEILRVPGVRIDKEDRKRIDK